MIFSAQIIDKKDNFLIIKFKNPQQDCPKCLKGEGCGAGNSWFLIFLKNREIKIKKPKNLNVSGNNIKISIVDKELNKLAFLFYLIPLFFIFTFLFFSKNYSISLQFLFFIFALVLSLFSLKFLEEKFFSLVLIKRDKKISDCQIYQA